MCNLNTLSLRVRRALTVEVTADLFDNAGAMDGSMKWPSENV